MAFEVYKSKYRTRVSRRKDEVLRMFTILTEKPDHVARIDMEPGNVYYYARLLGYKVSTHKVSKKLTDVRITLN